MLQDRLLSVLIAVGAKPMRWLATAHAILQGIGNRPLPGVLQFIALSLSFPVFELHNFLFQCSYALGRRRLRLLSREQSLLRVQQVALEGEFDIVDLRGGLHTVEGLKHVLGSLQAAKARTDFCNHFHPLSR